MCKEWKNWERLEFVGAGILENFQKIDAPPGGTGLAARRQCRDSESMWLQGEVLVLGVVVYIGGWNNSSGTYKV